MKFINWLVGLLLNENLLFARTKVLTKIVSLNSVFMLFGQKFILAETHFATKMEDNQLNIYQRASNTKKYFFINPVRDSSDATASSSRFASAPVAVKLFGSLLFAMCSSHFFASGSPKTPLWSLSAFAELSANANVNCRCLTLLILLPPLLFPAFAGCLRSYGVIRLLHQFCAVVVAFFGATLYYRASGALLG